MIKSGLWAAGLCFAFIADQAQAQVTVLGGRLAQVCYEAAKSAQAFVPDAVENCDSAISNETLSAHDLAGTYVNRGIIHFYRKNYDQALRDFDAATARDPTIAEGHVNRGAVLVQMERPKEGLVSLNLGIAMNASLPERAYYNRAIANESLGNIKEAYLDFLKASELSPDWTLPRKELERFTVRPKDEQRP